MEIKIIGVYKITETQDCHLIEIEIRNSKIALNLSKITQPIEDLDKLNWQVPYKEYLLDVTGENILSKEWENIEDEKLIGSFRIVFYFHFIDIKKPLSTQYGDIKLPPITNLPERLKDIQYTYPD